MAVIPIKDEHDQRVRDYLDVRERQLAADFSDGRGPTNEPGDPPASPGPPASAHAPLGKFMAEGELLLERLIASAYPVVSVLCTPERLAAAGPLLARLDATVPVYVMEKALLERTIGYPLHRGLMAIGARTKPRTVGEVVAGVAGGARPRVFVVLEDLTNHDNIGAVFRNAAGLGAAGVLLSPGCADPLYRKCVRVSMGHVLHVPWTRVPEWPSGLAALRDLGLQVVALTPQRPSVELRDFVPAVGHGQTARRGIALLVGTEGPGLSPLAIASADARVRISMEGGVDSLNVAVATAVALEHLRWAIRHDTAGQ